MNIDKILQGYLETALWSSYDDDFEPLDSGRDVSDCADTFTAEALDDIKGMLAYCNETGIDLRGIDSWTFGMAFWLSRNGHGAGFFDRGCEPRWNQLQAAAKTFGERNLYVNEFGKVCQE